MLKIKDVRSKKDQELKDLMVQHKKELMNLRFRRVREALASPIQFRLVRREIARIKTVLHERQMTKV